MVRSVPGDFSGPWVISRIVGPFDRQGAADGVVFLGFGLGFPGFGLGFVAIAIVEVLVGRPVDREGMTGPRGGWWWP